MVSCSTCMTRTRSKKNLHFKQLLRRTFTLESVHKVWLPQISLINADVFSGFFLRKSASSAGKIHQHLTLKTDTTLERN
jgi:hypothetical protein